MTERILLVRADGNSEIGIGHIMRCSALAQVWNRAGGRTVFAVADESTLGICDTRTVVLSVKPGSEEDARRTVNLAHELNAAWIVTDGYNFGPVHREIIRRSEIPVLIIDDTGFTGRTYADLILNQNVTADISWYGNRDLDTRFLLGPRYALLRSEFRERKDRERDIPEIPRKVLITFGGSDPDNATSRVIRALSAGEIGWEETEFIVIVGPRTVHRREIESAITDSPLNVRIEYGFYMAEVIAGADIAISAAGCTCWEMAFTGLPSILIPIAENQRLPAQGAQQTLNAEALDSIGVAINVGNVEGISAALKRLTDPKVRRKMSQAGTELVDGRGAERVLITMHEKRYDCSLQVARDSYCDE